jgi:hypothetical protein
MKFVKKPVVVEAFRYGFDKLPHWMYGKTWLANEHENTMTIHTLEGDMKAMPGDFIIKGVQGEIYPCKAEIFEATYEKLLES